MTQKEALLKAIKIWGNSAFARRYGCTCAIGYLAAEGPKLVVMGDSALSWEKAFKDYEKGRLARYEAALKEIATIQPSAAGAIAQNALKHGVILLMLLCAAQGHALFHSSHRSQVVKDTLSELALAARVVGQYQQHPPALTDTRADELYVTRAEADINIAMGTLVKYKHHHCAEQDVRTAISQLERDLEDIPPAHWPPDTRAHA